MSSVAEESTELTDMLLPTPVAREALVAMLPVATLSLLPVAKDLVAMLAGNLNTEGFLPLGGNVVDFFMADWGVLLSKWLPGDVCSALLCMFPGVCGALLSIMCPGVIGALLCMLWPGDPVSRIFSRLDLCCCCANNSYGPFVLKVVSL